MNTDKKSGDEYVLWFIYTDNPNICFLNMQYKFYIYNISTSLTLMATHHSQLYNEQKQNVFVSK